MGNVKVRCLAEPGGLFSDEWVVTVPAGGKNRKFLVDVSALNESDTPKYTGAPIHTFTSGYLVEGDSSKVLVSIIGEPVDMESSRLWLERNAIA